MEMRKSRGRGDGRERIKLNFYTFSGRYQRVLWMETSRRRPNRTSPGVGEMRSRRSDSEGGSRLRSLPEKVDELSESTS